MSELKAKGVVLYCDGSAAPNPGPIGWGVHGYAYNETLVKKPILIDNHLITNKGYMSANQVKTLAHTPVEPIIYFDFLGSSLQKGSNNKAEIYALLHGLTYILDTYEVEEINIHTDSEYVVNGSTKWIYQWAKQNWRKQDGSQVSNYETWDKLLAVLAKVKERKIMLNIQWVKGHMDILGNVQADVLAGIGTNHSIAKVNVSEYTESPPQKYWKYEVPKHPLLNYKRIYFNSNPEFNTPGNYFQADPGGSDFIIGKRIPEAGFSVVQLAEPDLAIEIVKKTMYGVPKDFNVIAMIKLDRLYSTDIYKYVMKYADKAMIKDKRNLNLNFIDRKPVCLEVNPTGLSLRAIEAFGLLEDMLVKFCTVRRSGSPTDNFSYHDITDKFFLTEEKVSKNTSKLVTTLKEELVVGFSNMIVSIPSSSNKPIDINLTLGLDILPRNNLKKIEGANPKIYLITWHETVNSIRYATIVDSDLGIGIYSNYYADKIYI